MGPSVTEKREFAGEPVFGWEAMLEPVPGIGIEPSRNPYPIEGKFIPRAGDDDVDVDGRITFVSLFQTLVGRFLEDDPMAVVGIKTDSRRYHQIGLPSGGDRAHHHGFGGSRGMVPWGVQLNRHLEL